MHCPTLCCDFSLPVGCHRHCSSCAANAREDLREQTLLSTSSRKKLAQTEFHDIAGVYDPLTTSHDFYFFVCYRRTIKCHLKLFLHPLTPRPSFFCGRNCSLSFSKAFSNPCTPPPFGASHHPGHATLGDASWNDGQSAVRFSALSPLYPSRVAQATVKVKRTRSIIILTSICDEFLVSEGHFFPRTTSTAHHGIELTVLHSTGEVLHLHLRLRRGAPLVPWSPVI